MNALQQHAYDQYMKSLHLAKRLKPENYWMFDIPQKLLRLDIAEKILLDNGLIDEYMSVINFVNDVDHARNNENN